MKHYVEIDVRMSLTNVNSGEVSLVRHLQESAQIGILVTPEMLARIDRLSARGTLETIIARPVIQEVLAILRGGTE